MVGYRQLIKQDILDRFNPLDAKIDHAKGRLSKDYYTKKEVDKLVDSAKKLAEGNKGVIEYNDERRGPLRNPLLSQK